MAHIWDGQLIQARYHLGLAKRLFENFENFEAKRFLSSTLTELAKGASMIVNAMLLYSHSSYKTRIPVDAKPRLTIFKKTSEKVMGQKLTIDILAIFDIKRAQKNSPVELLKKDKILLLDNGEYKALTQDRLASLLDSLDTYCRRFSELSKAL